MITQLDIENADRDLTSQVTVLTHTPDASKAMLCKGFIKFGDGSKDLDGSGGTFELSITVGGQTIEPDPQEMEFSTAVRTGVWTTTFPVPANAEVVLKVKSPNGADTDVDVTAYLYDVSAQGVMEDNNLDHLAKEPTGSADMTNEVVDDTVISRWLANGDTSDFAPSTDSMHPLRENTDLAALQTTLQNTQTDVQSNGTAIAGISNVTRLSAALPPYFVRPSAGNTAVKVTVYLKDTDGNMEDPDGSQLALLVSNSSGVSRNTNLYKEEALTNNLDAGTGTFVGYNKLEKEATGVYYFYYKVANDADEEVLQFRFGWEESSTALYEGKSSQVTDATNDLNAIKLKTDQLNFTGTDVKATLDSEKVQVSGIDADVINAASLAAAAVTKIQNSLGTEANQTSISAAIAALNNITASDVITSLKASTGWTRGGVQTFLTIIRLIFARAASKQSDSNGTKSLEDYDDNTKTYSQTVAAATATKLVEDA